MGAATVDLTRLPTSTADSLWNHTASAWALDTFWLIAIGATLVLVTAALLHRDKLHRPVR